MDYRQTAGFSRSCHVLYESLGILSRCACVCVSVCLVFDGENAEDGLREAAGVYS